MTDHNHGEHHAQHHDHSHSGVGFASPAEALAAPPEEFVYVAALHTGTGIAEPDFLAAVDVHPESDTYGKVIHRTPAPTIGDEFHHYGWQVCSSACHTSTSLTRQNLVVPGFVSGNIHIIDVGSDPRAPRLGQVISGEDIAKKTGLTRPHTVHCMPGEIVTISMLGDRDGNADCGFAVLDAKNFDVLGRWEAQSGSAPFNYDFWYQPRKNVMVSSEFGAPNAYEHGFDPAHVAEGKYGQRIHFWDLTEKTVQQTIDLGAEGLIPLEVRWLHDPEADEGYVGAALSSALFRWSSENGGYRTDKVVQVTPVEVAGWPFPVPGLITDLVISVDDRFLYLSNWLHGDLRQYDISDPANPRLTGQLWLGGVIGHPTDAPWPVGGGPQMLQLSLDGRRLYVTNSLFSSWDNQFYPGMDSWMLKIDCHPDGGMTLDERFKVDFGGARGHEIHLPSGDATTEIFP